MKKFVLYVVLASIIAGIAMFAKNKGYKSGYKKARTEIALEKNKAAWEMSSLNKFPIDPAKPTVRMMTINFGDDIPPEMSEIAPLHQIIREKYNIEYVNENPDIILNGPLPKHKVPDIANAIKIFYTAEVYLDNNPPQYVDTYDLVLGFDFIDKPNYLRLPFQYVAVTNKVRHDYKRPMTCNPKKEHFACFLVSNGGEWQQGKFAGAAARTHLFHRLSLYKKVLSGGKYLNNVGGPVPDTTAFLSQCKFTIAYENTLDYPGYVTEKPFNAWLAGTVPIYNTDPSGLVDINKNAVIFAPDFKDEEALVDYIIKVDNDDKLYCDIWNQQIVTNPDKDYEVVKAELRKKIDEIFAKKLKVQEKAK